MPDTSTSFITGADLQPYAPNIPIETLNSIAVKVEALFCDLLPLKLEERERSFEKWEVFRRDWRFLVQTSLLNIQSAKDEADVEIEGIKVDWHLRQNLRFQSIPVFAPIFILKITSGYKDDELPARLKQAMIDYAVEQALIANTGLSSKVASYKMGERTISFRENSSVKETVIETISFYQPL